MSFGCWRPGGLELLLGGNPTIPKHSGQTNVCVIYTYIYDAEQLVTSPDVCWHPARVTFQVKARPFTKASPLYQIPKWSQHRRHHTIAGFWLASSWSGFFWPAATFSNGPKTWSCLIFLGNWTKPHMINNGTWDQDVLGQWAFLPPLCGEHKAALAAR